ncbi:HNH endonuclease signature motif containing protein [Franconibacter daqui]|uniref:HNH endonuclease signature motif containing protein n=1 Tax=Franconibacter daqui TaxID=2047724 RepID=A0ABV1PMH3_9ENTR
MKNLTELRTSSGSDWLTLAIESDKEERAKLKAIEQQLLTRYGDYKGIIDNFDKQPAKSIYLQANGEFTAEKKLLMDFYKWPPAKLKAIFYDLRNKNKMRECPYCGNPVRPNTLDHFVPESHWPEFALYPDNLVPQCQQCASKKSNRYYMLPDKGCFFIHPKFVDELSRLGFKIEMRANSDAIAYTPSINISGAVTDKLKERIKRHITALDIPAYMVAYCQKQERELLDMIEQANSKKMHFSVQEHCQRQYNTQRLIAGLSLDENPEFYPNWACAYYYALLASPVIINNYQKLLKATRNPPVTSAAVASSVLFP